MVIADNHITTSLAATGEIITEHYIDTARDYQKPYWKKGDPPLDPKHEGQVRLSGVSTFR